MSRLQAIETALVSINATVFQELCDSYLALRNKNYATFVRTGTQSAKQKTTKGTPDSFFLMPDGKYIFVEYSTNISAGVGKLEDDIKKCLDVTKTSIPHNQIKEIILCTNFKLSTTDNNKLQKLVAGKGILLTIETIDSLSIELHMHHRNLVHQYLGLPLDTGQIVSISTFINEYDKASKGIATPINNEFLHRETELTELKNAIDKNDFVIVTGVAGVGKTKLCIETIQSYLIDKETFKAYCISYKSHTLLDDLFQNLGSDDDIILFVDDANRIDRFSQITGYYKASRKGKLKIIITVRDYAYDQVDLLCQGFSPFRVNVSKLSDEQITDIIKSDSFGIKNPDYQREIIRIADGNPRLAIMAALLAKKEQNLNALRKVGQLFDLYFSTFIKDDGEFAKETNIQILGLIVEIPLKLTTPFRFKVTTRSGFKLTTPFRSKLTTPYF